MKLVLDLPPAELSPNRRVHWAKKARAVKYYRAFAAVVARCAPNYRKGWERAEVRAVFHLPDARRRDPDNLMAAMKAAWDGFVDAGVLADDNGLILHPPVLAIDRAHPRVEVTLTEAA